MAGLIYDFIETLELENQQYLKLIEIGELKRTHIIKGNLKELNDINTVEEHTVSKSKTLEKKRIELMNDIAMILNLDKASVTITQIEEGLKNQPEEAAALNKIKTELKKSLAKLKIVNDENMILIKQSLEYTEFSMNVLQSSMGSAPLTADYGKGGESRSNSIFDAKQ